MSVAASPVTWGVAMLVPVLLVYPLGNPARAEVTVWPGATTFGFMRRSPVGPRLLEVVTSPAVWYPLSYTLPTVRAFFATAGLPIVEAPGPSLPALTMYIWRLIQTL
jgi:hypothetical protein